MYVSHSVCMYIFMYEYICMHVCVYIICNCVYTFSGFAIIIEPCMFRWADYVVRVHTHRPRGVDRVRVFDNLVKAVRTIVDGFRIRRRRGGQPITVGSGEVSFVTTIGHCSSSTTDSNSDIGIIVYYRLLQGSFPMSLHWRALLLSTIMLSRIDSKGG